MKKLIALFLMATVLSCSSEDQESQNVSSLTETSGSVLEGKVLSFKNEESFVKEYSDLAELKSDELQNWISTKGVEALLNTSDELADMEGDVISETRIIYSPALKAILNTDSKMKIAGKVIWLNERSFYILSDNEINKNSKELLSIKDKLIVYGKLLSVSESSKNLTSRSVLPNENRGKTFASEEMNVSGSRLRHVVDLYNETVVLNDRIQTSKMFVRSILQYRSCSTFGGCKWKEAYNARVVSSNFYCGTCGGAYYPIAWGTLLNIYTPTGSGVTGTQTFLIANWRELLPPINPSNLYTNFVVSGPVTCSIVGSIPAVETSINLSWY